MSKSLLLPPLVPHDKIEAMRTGVAPPLTPRELERRTRTLELQEVFLETYRRSASPLVACRRAGITAHEYARWKSTDPDFAERLNQITEHWQEELISSAVSRAIGYTAADENGNVLTDAEGRVIRHGASDALARALLNLERPVVQVNLPTVVFSMEGVDPELEERPVIEQHGEITVEPAKDDDR